MTSIKHFENILFLAHSQNGIRFQVMTSSLCIKFIFTMVDASLLFSGFSGEAIREYLKKSVILMFPIKSPVMCVFVFDKLC